MQPNTPDKLSSENYAEILEFLKSHPIGVLATIDENGDPNASTIYFSVDDKLRISFTTKRETRKFENIARHNKVALVAYEAKDQSAVQVSGRAEEVKDEQEALDIYNGTVNAAKKTSEDNVPPVAKYSGGPFAAFRIEIEDIRLMAYGKGDRFSKSMEKASSPPSTGDPS
ncbi:MAG TPA: pyridoxamine 5'-phosphate oxidase family protein [Candidatus Saccharimonadales bacterium]|nr:pyridoxamine 5'-phosphate oxidase family protein [Candidatus Saccharimonadales bacterium]